MVLTSTQVEFVLFGKALRLGSVKTRLFPDDPEKCLLLYKAFFKDFLRRYNSHCTLPLRPLIDIETDREREELSEILESSKIHNLDMFVQIKDDFFKRLAAGVSQIESPYFFLTGTDLPHFPFHFLNELKMETNTVYIGPDIDGGIYFAAGPKESARCFDIDSSPEKVGHSLVRNFQKHGYEVKLLKEWSDIDTIEDLHKCLERFGSNELTYTYEALRELKNNDENNMSGEAQLSVLI
jgi:glycosyltransferase A (GT-A) superfamily protein (DUF2064 family)